MVSTEDLKKILLLQHLPDSLLEKILPLLRHRECQEGEVLFEEGGRAENFHMLTRGKIVLEVEVSPRVIMSVGSVKPGHSFGWSALTPADPAHKFNAISTEYSEVLSIPGREFLNILEQDPAVGYQVMKNIFAILKRQLERRTIQLVSVMRKYPGMRELLEETS